MMDYQMNVRNALRYDTINYIGGIDVLKSGLLL